MSKNLSENRRNGLFKPFVVVKLAENEKKWLKQAIFRFLGGLISTPRPHQFSQKSYFLSRFFSTPILSK